MGFGHSARTQTISHVSYLALMNGMGVSMPFPVGPMQCPPSAVPEGHLWGWKWQGEVLVAHQSCPGMTALIWCQTADLCELCGMRGPAPREGRGGERSMRFLLGISLIKTLTEQWEPFC